MRRTPCCDPCRGRTSGSRPPDRRTSRRGPPPRSSRLQMLLDDLLRIILPAFARQPARGPPACPGEDERRETRDRTRRQDETPIDAEPVEDVGDDDREEDRPVPRGLRAGEAAAPAL